VKKLFFAACVGAFIVWCVSVAVKSMGSGPEVVFSELLEDRESVSELDGFVRKGDGYDVQMRFLAEDDWIRALPYQGFEKADCLGVRAVIRFSLLRTAVWPPWRPEELHDVLCFRRRGKNAWSPDARELLLVEPDSGWVYFASEGREHDRALPGYGDVDPR
jgi:hypothetical protein